LAVGVDKVRKSHTTLTDAQVFDGCPPKSDILKTSMFSISGSVEPVKNFSFILLIEDIRNVREKSEIFVPIRSPMFAEVLSLSNTIL
jgi:hypothetical protein